MSICSGSTGSSLTLLEDVGSSACTDDACADARSLARSAAGIVGGNFTGTAFSAAAAVSRSTVDTGAVATGTGAGAATLVDAVRRYALMRA
jgi:hypothetical protein